MLFNKHFLLSIIFKNGKCYMLINVSENYRMGGEEVCGRRWGL